MLSSLREQLADQPDEVRRLALEAVELCQLSSKKGAAEQLAAKIRESVNRDKGGGESG